MKCLIRFYDVVAPAWYWIGRDADVHDVVLVNVDRLVPSDVDDERVVVDLEELDVGHLGLALLVEHAQAVAVVVVPDLA